jgi:PHP family Zn ribbon phosphoesterase
MAIRTCKKCNSSFKFKDYDNMNHKLPCGGTNLHYVGLEKMPKSEKNLNMKNEKTNEDKDNMP